MIKTPWLYKAGRFVLTPIFKLYYSPKIIGKENLNIEKPMIIAGNHIHLYDQCNAIISTKKYITYMAKKEYFDSKKTRWFFQSVGCIPVDRKRKDENAVTSALEVLEKNGYIGIFPEGTRNALKEEHILKLYKKYNIKENYEQFFKKIKRNKLSQISYCEKLLENNLITKEKLLNHISDIDDFLKDLVKDKIITKEEYINSLLLDFKFGAVSMAKKKNAYVVPMAITGSYKFRSKDLKVRFGKPFKIKDMDLESANNKLFNEMKKLIDENIEDGEKDEFISDY